MADTALIYLAPGAFHQTLAEAPVLFQPQAGEAPQNLTLTEALSAVAGGEVHLVVTTTEALATGVVLSRKQARHLQRVLPFLLEEQLLDAPESLWFASGKPRQGHYPVVALARDPLEALLALCREHEVRPGSLKVDADLLASDAPLILSVPGWSALIAGRDQALVVEPSQIDMLLTMRRRKAEEDADEAGLSLEDVAEEGEPEASTERLDDPGLLCDRLREALRRDEAVEVLQGPYAPRKGSTNGPSPWSPWKPVLGLAAAVFIVALTSLWVQEWRYSRAAAQSFQEAAQLYQSLFPEDEATVGLRRQFKARLARLSRGSDQQEAAFFKVLPVVASTLSGSGVEPKRLQFDSRDGSLLLDIDAGQYSDLQKLQATLRDKGVQATIANYRNGAEGITARIKVEQAG